MKRLLLLVAAALLLGACATNDNSGQSGAGPGFGRGGATISSDIDDTDSGTGGR